jgi:hypothetical protein
MNDKNKQLDQQYNMKAEVARLIGGQFGGYPFTFTKRIPSAVFTGVDVAVELLADDVLNQYGAGVDLKVYPQDFRLAVDGATAWTAAQTLSLEDTDAAPVQIAAIASAQLTANAALSKNSAGVTLAAAYNKNTGLTKGKGIQMRLTSAGPVVAGSDLVLTISGVIR